MVTFNFPVWTFSLNFAGRPMTAWGGVSGRERGGISRNELFQGQRSYPKCNRAAAAGEAEGAMRKCSIKPPWQVLHCGRHVNEWSGPTFTGHFLTLK